MKLHRRKLLALALAVVMACCAGCGGRAAEGGADGQNAGGSAGADELAGGQEKSMGRYLETEYDLSGFLSRPGGLTRLEDGSFAIFDFNSGLYVSSDEGANWEPKELPWFNELRGSEAYIMDIAVSAQGGFAVVYSDKYSSQSEDEDAQTQEQSAGTQEQNADTQEQSAQEGDASAEDGAKAQEEDYFLHPQYAYFDAEGNKTQLDIPYVETQQKIDYVTDFYFAADGSLYGAAFGGKVWELNTEDGSGRTLTEAGSTVEDMVFINHRILMSTKDELLFFNKDSKSFEEKDEVLYDFFQNETGDDKYSYSDMSILLMLPGEAEDNTVYLAFDKGLYRHVLGGSVMERLIDGSLSTLGEPSSGLIGMQRLSDERFLILFSSGKLILYTYDETVSSVPETMLRAYSLTENALLRQAISNYQKENTDVYVKYEIGMAQDTGVTKEDALKKLNTEIMAGNGPDILMMDGLPIQSYLEKGMLADITPYLQPMLDEGALLENIVDAYRTEDKLYMLPTQISVMVMAGGRSSLDGISDIKTLADAVEAIRREHPQGAILRCYTEEVLLRTLLLDALPSITADGKQIDTAKLSEFLTQAKRIYQAESAGLPPEEVAQYREIMQDRDNFDMKYVSDISSNSFSMVTGEARLLVGTITDFDWSLGTLCSLDTVVDDFGFGAYHGMGGNVFQSGGIVAVSAKSEHQELAGQLLQTMFSEKTLDSNVQYGFCINKNTLQKKMEEINGRGGEVYGGMSSTDADGNYVTFDVRGATKEELNTVMGLLEQAKIPNAGFDVIADAIYEIGPDALNGTADVEAAVDNIMKKVAIYLAE